MNTRILFPTPKPHERGRPRKFDPDAVLIAAGRAFWEKGYHATSIEDLCTATGVLRGSLYAAFGDKRGLLLAAEVLRYQKAGLLRAEVDEATAGTFLLATAQGLRVLNKVFREEDLNPVVDLILQALQ